MAKINWASIALLEKWENEFYTTSKDLRVRTLSQMQFPEHWKGSQTFQRGSRMMRRIPWREAMKMVRVEGVTTTLRGFASEATSWYYGKS